VLVLLVRYGTEKYPSALTDLLDFYRVQLPGVDPELIVIDNALPPAHQEDLGRNIILIGGDNASWEFSGWDRGIAFAGRQLEQFDLVQLATDAFRALNSAYLDGITQRMLDVITHRAAALGHIDYFNQPVDLFGHHSQAWIRTSALFIPPAELQFLGSLVSVNDSAAFFSGDPSRPFVHDAPLSETFRGYIVDWLTGEGTGQGVTWHSRFALDEAELARFQAKALAVVNEHALSIRLRAQGCATVDAIWLAGRIARQRFRSPRPLRFPDWQTQLAERTVHARRDDRTS